MKIVQAPHHNEPIGQSADGALIMLADGSKATAAVASIVQHASLSTVVSGSRSHNHSCAVADSPQPPINGYAVMINNRTLIDVQSGNTTGTATETATATDPANGGQLSKPHQHHHQRQQSRPQLSSPACCSSSIEHKWYSLPLRWRTHPSAVSVERPRRSPAAKPQSKRHSWHASSARSQPNAAAGDTADVDADSGRGIE